MSGKSPMLSPKSPRKKKKQGADEVASTVANGWPVLIVDDEPEVHRVTELALAGFRFADRPLEIINAMSAAEARKILELRSDIAVILLDVVMETEHAGLDLAQWIRNGLGNTDVRIVLRTGQPGQAPEREVITTYDINDYKEKTELTARKLHTLFFSCLRSWRDIKTLEATQRGLDLILNGAGSLFSYQPANRFAETALHLFHDLLHLHETTTESPMHGLVLSVQRRTGKTAIMAGAGRYSPPLTGRLEDLRPDLPDDLKRLESKIPENGHFAMDGTMALASFRSSVEIKNILMLDGVDATSIPQRPVLDIFCRTMAYAMDNYNLIDLVERTQKEVVQRLGEAVETRAMESSQHVRRVAEYSWILALAAGMPRRDAQVLLAASPLHDVGKIGIPDAILNKPGKLTDEEWEVMKTHAIIGEDMLIQSDLEILKCAAIIAGGHHERWDGTGYPRRLSGKIIPLPARITAIADVFDSLASDSVYKKAWPLERILQYFEESSGTQFDPSLVRILFEKLPDLLEARDRYRDDIF
ncbi:MULTISPECIES: HD domain-containing phosphohydrolase [unclassified Haematospirillum]|uniref:HD domain-containing phosphohydrolase n=1 Tax=unclassified Haematospirillum TaxID=2622088 RepID=UPI00143A111A|nr:MULTISPECIES: HD domain-containing phosphohydrolase [unclassified Haematospirillum]NKD54745.1 DUF3369 domain-containing protein [Haematospirillum sp. H4890]NKD74583.1 DUF3369 domain-containing protein [Haematospirillum sp. H4485]